MRSRRAGGSRGPAAGGGRGWGRTGWGWGGQGEAGEVGDVGVPARRSDGMSAEFLVRGKKKIGVNFGLKK